MVNLFQILRDDPQPLVRAISLTPYSRREYDSACGVPESGDRIERARRFLVRSWQGHGFRSNRYKVGWKNDVAGREAAYAVRSWTRLPQWLEETTNRLRSVQIENRPALEVIERFNRTNVLLYCDPPYLLSTRTGPCYKHEMTDRDHVDLLEALTRHKGAVLLSGYDNSLYNEYLSGWHKEQCPARAEYGAHRTETLWMNFEHQLRL